MAGKIIRQLCDSVYNHKQFRIDFEQLLSNELKPNEQKQELSSNQIKKLAECASILSLSDNDNHRKLAFKLAIFLFRQFREDYESMSFMAELVLSRLGDLPTIGHMFIEDNGKDYFSYFHENHNLDLISFKFPETTSKKILNQIEANKKETWSLTDFQAKIFHKLLDGKSVAYAAPTSAGKSFVIHNYTAFKLATSSSFTAVYILPTKTLIAEVQRSIQTKLRKLSIDQKDVMVVTSANDVNVEQLQQIPKKVLVLTQERLQHMLSKKYDFNIDLLVIDEAQKVRDVERGVILEDVVNEVAGINPNMQAVLISPFVGNLTKFKDIFEIHNEVETISSSKTPVGRNIFHVNFTDDFVLVDVYSEELKQKIELAKIAIPEDVKIPTTQYGTKAWMATNLLKDTGHTLIYCTKPDECKKVAKEIAPNIKEVESSQELEDTIKFMESNVHEQYDLIDALKSGIGYHYGKMPHFVRLAVQEIFEQKKINYLCCTSTLLEGVNLPAKNIVLYKPKKGLIEAMDKYTIRNLAGRVGRLGKDYYGNIYCVDIEKWEKGSDAFDDELEEIESSIEHTLSIDIELLIQHLQEYREIERGKTNIRSVATSLIVKHLKDLSGNVLKKLQKKYPDISNEHIETINTLLNKINNDIQKLDKNVIFKNGSIDPRLQYKLYEFLKQTKNPPILPYPENDEMYSMILKVFELIHKFILTEDQKRHSVKLCSYIAMQWINQHTYKGILENRINYEERRNNYSLEKKEINKLIDSLDEILEQDLKFVYARGLRCYADILDCVIKEENLELNSCSELPEHLESGAHDKRVYLLMNLGLSRNNAITVSKMMKKGKINTIPECMDWLQRNGEEIRRRFQDKIMLKDFEHLLEPQ